MKYIFRVRSEAVGKLAWFLANEVDSVKKQPQFSELDVSGLTNLLLVDSPRALVEDAAGSSVFQVLHLDSCSLGNERLNYPFAERRNRAHFSISVAQVDGLEKVLNIFTSDSVEDDVRKSAAEQLSVMLHGQLCFASEVIAIANFRLKIPVATRTYSILFLFRFRSASSLCTVGRPRQSVVVAARVCCEA